MNQAELNELKTRTEAMTLEEQYVVAAALPDFVILTEITGRLNKYRDIQKAIGELKNEQ